MLPADLREAVERDRDRLLADLIQIAQQPGPPGDVDDRAVLLEERFRELPVSSVYRDPHGNLVVECRQRDGPALGLTANLESPFPRSVNHTVFVDDRRVRGPGVVDNALGLASLLSVVRIFEDRLPVNFLLVATANERDQGNAQGVRGFLDDAEVDLGAALTLEAKGLGRIDHRSLGTSEITIRIEGPRSTVWPEEREDNPIEVMASLLENLSSLRREVHRQNGDVYMNLGKISGGESAETVPYECELKLQIRSRSNGPLTQLRKQVLERMEEVRSGTDFPIHIQQTVREPARGLDRDHWLVRTVADVQNELSIDSRYGATSSDASVFLNRGVPALTLGLGREEHVYREEEQLAVDSLTDGQQQLAGVVLALERRHSELS